MSGVVAMSQAEPNAVAATKSIETITGEINGIKSHVAKTFLLAQFEIGGLLIEAKKQLKHGEWMKWLEESVYYSQSTANNLMKIHSEFADGEGKFATIGNLDPSALPYTKALALIGVPAEEREEFVQQHDIENMSAAKIKDAIREKEDAERRAQEAEELAEQQRKEAEEERVKRKKLEEKTLYQSTEVERLKAELKEAKESGNEEDVQRLQRSLEESENELIDSRNKIKELEKKLKEKPMEVPATVEVEKVPPEIEAELADLRKKVSQIGNSEAAIKFKVCFESLGTRFNELMTSLAEIPEADRPKYQEAVKKMLGNLAASIA